MVQPEKSCWITFASSEDEAKQAVRLARSLRLVSTRKQIGVIVPADCPPEIR